jgi:predicted nuclease of predicted toxin-antitoxin system
MKLLIDRMLSHRLERHLEPHFPGTEHVDKTQRTDAEDMEVWEYARDNGFTILTKDADFLEISGKQGWPPKLIKLNIGNCSTPEVVKLLTSRKGKIEEFHEDKEAGLMQME